MKCLFTLLLLGLPLLHLRAWQKAPPPASFEIMNTAVPEATAASWILPKDGTRNAYGVYLFRHRLQLAEQPASFQILLTADNRYRLWVNGTPYGEGPQASDKTQWRVDPLDIAPALHAGENLIAVQVWNFGEAMPEAVMSVGAGLWVQGNRASDAAINTNPTWKALRCAAYRPLPHDPKALNAYLVAGPGEQVEGAQMPWGWQQLDFDDKAWPAACTVETTRTSPRTLAPRNLPYMERSPLRLKSLRRVQGLQAPVSLPDGRRGLSVPAHSEVRLLIDQEQETLAYPWLVTSGGAGSSIRLTYAEALFDAQGRKGDRNQVEGRHILGVQDLFLPDGGVQRRFETLAYRCFRFLELEIRTAEAPLVLEDLGAWATGYPFSQNARFSCSDPDLEHLWQVAWHTARCCAHDTYMDCPYYERLQYVGDTRIQSLISLYVSGDDRLMRNAIELYDASRITEGLTQSRYPSMTPQIISPFSLFWVEMIHDYWRHRSDPRFVEARFEGIQTVLAWFERHLDPGTGLLGPLPHWTFVDWPDEWPWDDVRQAGGVAPGAYTGGAAIPTLQFVIALDKAAELFRGHERPTEADHYAQLARKIRRRCMESCWDPQRQLFADTPELASHSQHVNALAVLAGVLSPEEARLVLPRVMQDKRLVQCTVYFRFYLLRALKQAGLGDAYTEELKPWKDMLALGLSTFAERPEPTRSDCHAWSASPAYDLLATVCGIEPGAPGFESVLIQPHLGSLQSASGQVPHPKGLIKVDYTLKDGQLNAKIELPPGLEGVFIWKQQSHRLKGGLQELTLQP